MGLPRVVTLQHLPPDSLIAQNSTGKIDYWDSYLITVPQQQQSIDFLTTLVCTSLPAWARGLFRLRNILVKPFGLSTAPLPTPQNLSPDVYYPAGKRAIFFNVVARSDSEILMSESDRHLRFFMSVRKTPQTSANQLQLSVTTVVFFNNIGGKIYFTPVKPFHKWIVKCLLRNVARYYTQPTTGKS